MIIISIGEMITNLILTISYGTLIFILITKLFEMEVQFKDNINSIKVQLFYFILVVISCIIVSLHIGSKIVKYIDMI